MQAVEEFMGSNDQTTLIKGKRTKRQRTSSPFSLAASSSSENRETGAVEDFNSISSPTTSGDEIYESTEEEDMANCLILLARGGVSNRIEENREIKKQGRFNSRKFAELVAGETHKAAAVAGFYVYECKTCNRSFPSFQALGGHRASHKKPKAAVEEKKSPVSPPPPPPKEDSEEAQFNKNSPFAAQEIKINKGKIHGCSICGAEFTSGQALGGHMRRHRTATAAAAANQATTSASSADDVKPRNVFSLDLNLPAPEDEIRETKFHFGSSQQALVFSTPALVDCHY